MTTLATTTSAPQDADIADELELAERQGWLDMVRGPQDRWAVQEGCYYDEHFADHAVRFFEGALVHRAGRFRGQPFTLQPWQRDDIIRPLYGWRRADGTRRYRTAFVFLPKKNGKTTMAAGMGLYAFFEPDPNDTQRPVHGVEVYAASTSQQTGETFFREASKLAESPLLESKVATFPSTKRLVMHERGSFIKVLAHKASSAEGQIASMVVLDEIHAMKNAQLYNALRWAGAASLQSLVLEITTAGVDTESLWVDRYRYSKRVLDGQHTDTAHLAYLAEADKDAEIDDVEQLRKANPSIGVTISEADIVRDAKQALAGTARDVAEFKRYRMNIPIGAEQSWISPELWDEGQNKYDLEDLRGRPCFAGLDLAKVSDFSALVLLWPPEKRGGQWIGAAWFWIPRAQVKATQLRGDHSYASWEADGLIEVTDGDTTDHRVIRDKIKELAGRFTVQQIGIDRNFDGWQFTSELFNDDELPAVGVGQGWRSQDVPMQRIEALASEHKLNFGGNPVMRWMVGNAVAIRQGTAANYHLARADGDSKVDGVAALINAMYLAEAEPQQNDVSQYYDQCPLV